jgi:hypothetical protein
MPATPKVSRRVSRSSPLPPVTILELDNLDRSILYVVKKGFHQAGEVMDGTRTWSTIQFRIFQACLAKLRPDLKSSKLTVEDARKSVDELTRNEIFEILAAEKADRAAAAEIADDKAKKLNNPEPPTDAEFIDIAPKVGVSLNES